MDNVVQSERGCIWVCHGLHGTSRPRRLRGADGGCTAAERESGRATSMAKQRTNNASREGHT